MLELKNICVNYSYKSVLNGINANFEDGKIYSILGENGAGKSTLARIISGDMQPGCGKIFIDGKEVSFKNPKAAIKNGIVCVHQRPLLSPSLSVNENLQIGTSKKEWKNREKVLNFCLPSCNLSTLVKNLNENQRFYISLARCLLKNPKILILDEGADLPLSKLRRLTENKITIIMITHDLDQALLKSDQVILLQDGILLDQKPAKDFSREEIEKKLYGISKEAQVPSSIKITDKNENEIHHIIGKTGLIPSDKSFTASNPNLTILQLLTAYHPTGKESQLKSYAEKLLKNAGVNIKLYEKVSCLSGGMLQKLILERELSENPKELYLYNPTKGLDLKAGEKLYQRLDFLAKNGTQVFIGKTKSQD